MIVLGLRIVIPELGCCVCALGTQDAFILKVSVVLARDVCRPSWVSVLTWKAAQEIERLSLGSACEPFDRRTLMLPSDTSVKPQFFVTTCVVLASKERQLQKFPENERMLPVFGLTVLRGSSHRSRGFYLATFTRAFDLCNFPFNHLSEKLQVFAK